MPNLKFIMLGDLNASLETIKGSIFSLLPENYKSLYDDSFEPSILCSMLETASKPAEPTSYHKFVRINSVGIYVEKDDNASYSNPDLILGGPDIKIEYDTNLDTIQPVYKPMGDPEIKLIDDEKSDELRADKIYGKLKDNLAHKGEPIAYTKFEFNTSAYSDHIPVSATISVPEHHLMYLYKLVRICPRDKKVYVLPEPKLNGNVLEYTSLGIAESYKDPKNVVVSSTNRANSNNPSSKTFGGALGSRSGILLVALLVICAIVIIIYMFSERLYESFSWAQRKIKN